MTYLDVVKLERDRTQDGRIFCALDTLVKLADDYAMIKDVMCECDLEGDGPCVWCQMKEFVNRLNEECSPS